jgi:heme/copper-type cytochrome/quinol oxidase subunit 2
MHAHRSAARAFLPAIALVAAGCTPGDTAAGYASDHDVIQVVSTNVQGKNVFIPSTLVVVAGKPYTLSIFNTTDTPHGFRIAGIGVEAILPAQEELEVRLPALEGGRVYQIGCQLHPPHRTATLVVVPASGG